MRLFDLRNTTIDLDKLSAVGQVVASKPKASAKPYRMFIIVDACPHNLRGEQGELEEWRRKLIAAWSGDESWS